LTPLDLEIEKLRTECEIKYVELDELKKSMALKGNSNGS